MNVGVNILGLTKDGIYKNANLFLPGESGYGYDPAIMQAVTKNVILDKEQISPNAVGPDTVIRYQQYAGKSDSTNAVTDYVYNNDLFTKVYAAEDTDLTGLIGITQARTGDNKREGLWTGEYWFSNKITVNDTGLLNHAYASLNSTGTRTVESTSGGVVVKKGKNEVLYNSVRTKLYLQLKVPENRKIK